jgi:demethylmenaquinone methyltransferase/2-methoxy-6-polyprenyl-1,4-benzoquinol methylase
MSNKSEVTPYGDEKLSKKGQVTQMFDKIAPYYDNLNRVLSLGIDVLWRKKAVRLLSKSKPQTILDMATGTADLAIMAARIIKPDKIVGMDISANMLSFGREKITKMKLDHIISLEQGDSENLSYNDSSFDAVMAAFGVRNFENLEKGLSEMVRVLKPGGSVVILEFSKPRIFPLKQLFNIYFKNILPVIGKLRSKDNRAYKYLYESVQVFPDYDSFTEILKKVGCHSAEYQVLSAGICCIYIGKK